MVVEKKAIWFTTSLGTIKITLALIAIGTFQLLKKHYWPTKSEIVLKSAATLNFQGTVKSIYRKRHDHNEMFAVLSNGYEYGVYADWEGKINEGDSLFKSLGSTVVKVFSKGTIKDTLDYKKLVERWH